MVVTPCTEREEWDSAQNISDNSSKHFSRVSQQATFTDSPK
uniref:Uncharacterized protein n=1 Tax=Anguilla anguilla TaxID=7936 RepID=A0A0E9RG21_ANGAN